MIRLSAFADEISPELGEQIEVLRGEGIRHVDLRSVWETNVLDLSDGQVETVARALEEAGISIACIASPIGKSPIDEPVQAVRQRWERAAALARRFGARFVRVFSFYPPARGEAGDPSLYRDEVIARMRLLRDSVIPVHENEKDIYGDTIGRCVDLLGSVGPPLVAAFDPANFIQCGQSVFPEAYEALQPWIGYVHVKDALANGQVVPAGNGVASWPELLERLRSDGYDGFFALEPHLAAAGQFSGFSGPGLFREASQAFQGLLRAMRWEHA